MYMCCNEAHGEYAKGFTFVTTPGACDKRMPCWCERLSSFCVFVPSLPWQLVGVHLGNWKEKTNSLLFAGSGTGKCTLYETIDGRPAADNNTQSGIQTGPIELWASWPATSPWVTSVGGTRFAGQKPGGLSQPQVAVDLFGSGGGFSTMYKQEPDATWQSAAVAKYFETVDPATLPPPGSVGFDPKARGTPDVSALAEGYELIAGGAMHKVSGTSAAAPAFAALVSLLNEARVEAGKPPMGFLNPFLYAHASTAFTDVTVGSNKRDRSGTPWPYGYNCSKGWDPVTGLGTPRFSEMLAAAMRLPTTAGS
jgi:hypothetical protein